MTDLKWKIKKDKTGNIKLEGYDIDYQYFLDCEFDYFEDEYSEDMDWYCDKYDTGDYSYNDLREDAKEWVIERLLNDPENNGIFDKYLDYTGDIDVDFSDKDINIICDKAFSGCWNIKHIKLPTSSLKVMGKSVFEGCKGLEEIKLPSSLKEIKGETFDGYDGIIEIDFSKYNPSQFDENAIKLLLNKIIDFLNKDNTDKDKKEDWCNYFLQNADIYYDEIVNNKDYLIFLIKNKCLSLKDIKGLLQLSSEKNFTEVSAMLLEYENNNFTQEDMDNYMESDLIGIADNFRTIDNSEDKNTITITRYTGNISSIEIPESIYNKTVTKIGESAFAECKDIKEIVFPESLTSIEENAFEGCSKIKDLNLPKNLAYIGTNAFSKCKGIKEIVFPENLTKIGDNAFEECSGIKQLTLPEKLSSIGANAFYKCKDIEEIIFPESLTSIGNNAFEECSGIKKIDLPEKLSSIGSNAFSKCKDIEEITLPKNLTKIGNNTFESCSGIKEVKLPENLTSIGSAVFKNCSNIIKVDFPGNLTSIGENIFEGCFDNIKEINFPEKINDKKVFSSLFDNIFYDFKKLTSLKIPEGITDIPDNAFASFENLEYIYIPSTVNKIGGCLFTNCKNLKTIEISDNNKDYHIDNGSIVTKDNLVIYCPENKKETNSFDNSLLTNTPVFLEEGTDGTAGKEGKYVLFGDWPQSMKAENVIIDEKHKYIINGFECYKGNDNAYYFKEQATVNNDNDKESPVTKEGFYYYFKMESIKWRILTDEYQNKKVIVSENILTNYCFDTHYDKKKEIERTVNEKTVYPNNYEHSTIRAYLNGLDGSDYDVENFKDKGFINMAFTPEAIKKIAVMNIHNDAASTVYNGEGPQHFSASYYEPETQDKIFLLSANEATYPKYNKKDDKAKQCTDYSKSIGTKNNWWLRTPYNKKNVVLNSGSLVLGSEKQGVVPALAINS